MKEYQSHVIKETHEDGKKLPSPIAWCGASIGRHQWHFVDTHHAAQSIDSSRVQPCPKCTKEIIKCFQRAE